MNSADVGGLSPRVQAALSGFLAGQHRLFDDIDPHLAPVARAIEAFVLSGGKRLRPAFGYWGYRGAGGDDRDEVVAAVSALELVQASALIHDDLMDGSHTRRGEPAMHRRFAMEHDANGWDGDPLAFGSSAAILLGDLCLAWSDELLRRSGLDLESLARARPVFDLMRTEVIAGQYLDVHAQVTRDTSTQRATTVARYKSAKYTVERPLLLGAAIADAPATVTACYTAFGLPIGEAFQLRDDVLGVFGDPARTGKPAGDDLREGKRTYLIASAFATADEVTAARLAAGLGDPGLTPEGIDDLRTILVDTGALAATEQRIDQLTGTALAALGQVDLANDANARLAALAQAATNRSA